MKLSFQICFDFYLAPTTVRGLKLDVTHLISQLQLRLQQHLTSSQQLRVQLQMKGFSQAQLQVQLQDISKPQLQLRSQLHTPA